MVERPLWYNMKEIQILKVQRRPTGSYMVTVPIEVIRELGIEKGDKIKVYLKRESNWIIYEPIS